MKNKNLFQKSIVLLVFAAFLLAKPISDSLFMYFSSDTGLVHKFMNPDHYKEKWESVESYWLRWDNDALKEGLPKHSLAILIGGGVIVYDRPLKKNFIPSFEIHDDLENRIYFYFNLDNETYEVNNLFEKNIKIDPQNNQKLIARTGKNATQLKEEISQKKKKFLVNLEKMKVLEQKTILISFLYRLLVLAIIYGFYLLIIADWDEILRRRLFKDLE